MTESKPASLILGLLAESYVHPGAGQSEGAIDLPVAREKTTDYPFVPGSGVKGAMRDRAFLEACSAARSKAEQKALEDALNRLGVPSEMHKAAEAAFNERLRRLDERRRQNSDEVAKAAAETATEQIYGKTDNAGDLLFSDAKLLLLPVRSLTGAYKWLTCPYLIERWQRDHRRCFGQEATNTAAAWTPPDTDPPTVLTQGKADELLFLEERVFKVQPTDLTSLANLVRPLVGGEQDSTAKRLASQLAVVRDDDFAFFARFGLPVHARNVLDENKVSKNLWYEETIAPDTLLYTLVLERKEGVLGHLDALLFTGGSARPYLQLGGNETIGQGWFRVAQVGGGAA